MNICCIFDYRLIGAENNQVEVAWKIVAPQQTSSALRPADRDLSNQNIIDQANLLVSLAGQESQENLTFDYALSLFAHKLALFKPATLIVLDQEQIGKDRISRHLPALTLNHQKPLNLKAELSVEAFTDLCAELTKLPIEQRVDRLYQFYIPEILPAGGANRPGSSLLKAIGKFLLYFLFGILIAAGVWHLIDSLFNDSLLLLALISFALVAAAGAALYYAVRGSA